MIFWVCTLESRINVPTRLLIFWKLSTQHAVIPATTIIKFDWYVSPPRLFKIHVYLKSTAKAVNTPPQIKITVAWTELYFYKYLKQTQSGMSVKVLNFWVLLFLYFLANTLIPTTALICFSSLFQPPRLFPGVRLFGTREYLIKQIKAWRKTSKKGGL